MVEKRHKPPNLFLLPSTPVVRVFHIFLNKLWPNILPPARSSHLTLCSLESLSSLIGQNRSILSLPSCYLLSPNSYFLNK